MRDDRRNPFEDGLIPRWASAWGQDRCGFWVAFEVSGVAQVLRWIPPGSFTMGSPNDEPGRHPNEGPQHDVTFTRGFWLGEAPVTQALWTAVMGADSNPSRFVDPRRPVETVSVDDVEHFLSECERQAPALALRLPIEAEWEYACRAGTPDATYAGPIEILGANNAPVLDAIAWYGGNSGVDFDLDEGADSSGWRERQHPHTKAGSRWVKQRRRNPWGLYDMLGNVEEWCGNDNYEYVTGDVVIDPDSAPNGQKEHLLRVVRGGSWNFGAQRVRAGSRGAPSRGLRNDSLGFRLAQGRSSGSSGGQQAPKDPHRTGFTISSAPSWDGRSPSGAVLERSLSTAGIPGPVIVDPHWQEDQDAFGIYADVRVPQATVGFRMRHIEPGTFLMGSLDDDPEALGREKPQHEVTLTEGFWLADAPCTQAVYKAIAGENPSRYQGAEHPVEKVSWHDAQTFIQALNERLPGSPFALPTEAQWEYACRAGATGPRYGPLNDVAWYADNSYGTTHRVRMKAPNAWGLYDTLGNVREWCLDEAAFLEPPRYTNSGRVDPCATGNQEPSPRVVRGGAWNYGARYVRAPSRDAYRRVYRDDNLGFRLARGRVAEP